MSGMNPSPQTTLVILLGASEWPFSSLQSSPAFVRSANRVRDYFCHPRQFGLPLENWLDLFDRYQSNPNEVDKAIGTFLDKRLSLMKRGGTPARDLLFYYIGHGVFASDSEQAYHLAIQSTRDENIGASAVAMASLAHTLKTKARYLRRIVILDCCFAARSFKYMQSAPDQVALEQTKSAFEEKSKGSGFPKKGTALLCSSGHKNPSLILEDESGTMFSEALVRALSLGETHPSDKTHLSLHDLQQSIVDMLEILAGGSAPRPEIHSPDQSDGNVATVPFFPNRLAEKERTRRAAGTKQARLTAKERSRRVAGTKQARSADEELFRRAAEIKQAHLADEEEQVRRTLEPKATPSSLRQAAKEQIRRTLEPEAPPSMIPRRATSPIQANTPYERRLYTALDISTTYAKAMIIEVQDDIGTVLGVGRYQQSYTHMSDGVVTDIPGVIANCNEALIQAEHSAGGVVAPPTVIGIAGELVKGSSTTVSVQRSQPLRPISPEELESLITAALKKLLKNAKERIAAEMMSYQNIDVRLANAAVISVSIDGQSVSNPIDSYGQQITLTLFSTFAPLVQLGALETVAQGLDLTLLTIVAQPYALACCLSTNIGADSGAIFIDIGGGTTDIALVRRGGIEETRMFALGGQTFTRRIATSKGVQIKDAERLKISYSNGEVKGSSYEEIRTILAPECQRLMDSIELLIEELARGELLPSAIYLVGGGSELPDLFERLQSFPWTERLPFARQPIIRTVLPEMVTNIADPNHLLQNAQDITLMALAYQAIGLQNEDTILEKTLYKVVHNLHL